MEEQKNKTNLRSRLSAMVAVWKLAVVGAVAAALLLLLTLIFGAGSKPYIDSALFVSAVVPYALALLFALGAVLYGVFGAAACREEEAKILLSARKDTSILESGSDVRFGAENTFDNYRKFAPYVITILAILLCGGILGGAYYYRQVVVPTLAQVTNYAETPTNYVAGAVIAALMMTGSILAGAFFIGQARLLEYRYLRPLGAYLVVGFAVMLGSVLTAICGNFGIIEWLDGTLSKVFYGVYVLLILELAVNFIIEFYRPRSVEEEHLIFESKLLNIFTEPGGVMRNVAELLDYQFGFKVSGTYLYGFLERAVFPMLLGWLLLLWASSTLHLVKPGELGVKEYLGKAQMTQLLEPGIYFSAPWPLGTVKCFSYLELHEIVIGEPEHEEVVEVDNHDHDHGDSAPKNEPKGPKLVINWTEEHGHGAANYFLVSGGDESNVKADRPFLSEAPVRAAQSLDLLCFAMPIQYRVRKDGIVDYAYNHQDPKALLTRLSEQAVTEILLSKKLAKVLSSERDTVVGEVKQLIQKLADEQHLGVEIVTVNLTDAHPPVAIGRAFYEPYMAQQAAAIANLQALTYQTQVLPEAKYQALRLKAEAEADRDSVILISKAEAARFRTQLQTYRILPSMFTLKAYLSFLEKDCADVRKYVVGSTFKDEVFVLNFEEKKTFEMLDNQLDSLERQNQTENK